MEDLWLILRVSTGDHDKRALAEKRHGQLYTQAGENLIVLRKRSSDHNSIKSKKSIHVHLISRTLRSSDGGLPLSQQPSKMHLAHIVSTIH